MDRLGKLILERVEDMTALDPATDKLLFIMDEPTGGTLESAMDTVWAEGKGGRRLYGLDRNKTASFTCTNGYLVTGALQAQVGGTIQTVGDDGDVEQVNVPVIEYLKTSDNKITLSYAPVTGSLKFIYEANTDLTQGKSYALGSDAATTFSVSGKDVTLPTQADKTKTYIAVYERVCKSGTAVVNNSDVYPSTAKCVFTLLCHETCDINKKVYAKLVFPNAKVDGNFTLDISGDAVTQELKVDAMADVCSTEKTYWTGMTWSLVA